MLKSTWLALGLLAGASVPAPGQETTAPQALDGAALFGQYCMRCHGLGVIAPAIDDLAKLDYEDVYGQLWYGFMAKIATGLGDAEKRALAEYIAGIEPNKVPRTSGARMCAGRTAHDRPGTEGGWPGWAPEPRNTRYLQGVSADPGAIRLRWAFAFPDWAPFTSGGNQITVDRGRVYVGSLNKFVYALDPDTGCAYWTFRADGRIRSAVAIAGDVAIVADTNANVYGLDADTGRLRWQRRVDLQPDARVTGNVTVHAGTVYVPVSSLEEANAIRADLPCCTFRGSVVALDAATGERKWRTSMIDGPLLYLGKSSKGIDRFGPSGVTVWSVPTVDEKRGLLYIATANQMTEPRVDESDAVVALDMTTGAKRWVRSLAPAQMGGQDIYHLGCETWVDETRSTCPPVNPSGQGDRDLGAPVILQTRADGSDVLLAGSKDGMVYALDPDASGAILWQRRLGRGGELGGVEYGMAADRERLYVPIADVDADLVASGSMNAVNLATGEIDWRVAGSNDTCVGKPVPPCNNAYLSAITVIDNLVLAGNNDGHLRAFDTTTGKVLWSYDTTQPVTPVNDVAGNGGAVAFGGPAIAGGRMYVVSGMGHQGIAMRGNVVLAFDLPPR
ncbi:MAG: PQQ-binding-like beta-propeller repeat protein [Gammaproteobacteria bacterium]|nr:PQQ-binding-like beta-propeller repeat protein [Gammaproteobacteria bacterium]